jgi:FkbM family methyltransferase
MLKRLHAYFQHFSYSIACVSRCGAATGLKYFIAPWLRRAFSLRVGKEARILVRGRSVDLAVFREVYLRGSYDVRCKTPKTILDAGANIGTASVFFAIRFPQAKIVAVEPEKSNLEMLRQNTAPYPNISVIEGAVWSERTKLRLKNPSAIKVSIRVEESLLSGDVEAYSIEDLAKLAGISSFDLLKIDIEGAEREVFDRAGPWLEKAGGMFVELHDRYAPGAGRAVMSRLVKRPFRLETPPGSLFVEFD